MSTPIRTPTAARWDCHACGDCCRMYDLGPVEPGIIAGLIERKIEDHWAPAKAQPWYESRRSPDGRELLFLTHKDGHCVFLRDDNLCAVHGTFGGEAKPGFCREFPFHVVEDPKGLVAVVRQSCVSYHTSFDSGTPVADQAEWAAALPRVIPRRKFAPDQVLVLPDVAVGLDSYMILEEQLLERLDGPAEDSVNAVIALRELTYKLIRRTPPTPDARRAKLAAGAVFEALRRLMEKAAGDPDPRASQNRIAFAKSLADALARALQNTSNREFTPEATAYLHLLLRTHTLAKGWQAMGGIAEGFGFFLLQVAFVRAAAHGEGPIEVADAAEMLVKWTKMTENQAILGVLRMARPALVDLFVSVEAR